MTTRISLCRHTCDWMPRADKDCQMPLRMTHTSQCPRTQPSEVAVGNDSLGHRKRLARLGRLVGLRVQDVLCPRARFSRSSRFGPLALLTTRPLRNRCRTGPSPLRPYSATSRLLNPPPIDPSNLPPTQTCAPPRRKGSHGDQLSRDAQKVFDPSGINWDPHAPPPSG